MISRHNRWFEMEPEPVVVEVEFFKADVSEVPKGRSTRAHQWGRDEAVKEEGIAAVEEDV